MKELFSQAIQKMKRKDFLDDVVREKTAEGNALTQELATLRKKNGVRVGGELDLKIYQINAKRSSIDKIVAKCKAEIKVLKKEILDLLTDCYVKAEAPELLSKVESAVYHAFEGKVKLLSDKDAGGVMGDSQIVGVIITHDKKKKFTTAKLVKAGAKNSQGVYLVRPQIVVYEYDKKQEEGIFRAETDDYKKRIKERKKSKVLSYLKNVYLNENSLYAIGFVALFAVFAVWATLGGFADACVVGFNAKITAVIVGACSIFTLITLKTCKKGGVADILPLVAILVSLTALACSFGRKDFLNALIFPIALLVYGVVAVVLRARASVVEEQRDQNGKIYAFAIVFGVVVAFALILATNAPKAYWLTLHCVTWLVFAISAFLSVAKKEKKIGALASWLSIAGSAFCVVATFYVQNPLVSTWFIITGIVFAVCPILNKLFNKENV